MLEEKKMLKIVNIGKSYEKFNALQNINFEIKPGELVVLLGPNGAGKSTLFSIIAGLITPDNGKCIINEQDISFKTVAALKNLGIVFQQPTIDMELNIFENLFFHARLHGLNIKTIFKTIQKELRDYKLSNKTSKKVRLLSGGERRKVELIRALLHNPKILLMDEPTVGLDPTSRKELLNKVHNLKKKNNLGILWTTHLVDEAEKADKIIVLCKGLISGMGSPNNIMRKTKTKTLSQAFFKLVDGKEG